MRQGLKAMVSGAISPLGRGYLVEVRAVAAQSGDQLALSQEQAMSKEAVIKQLGMAASGLRRKLGESVASLTQFDAPLPQATTTSLEALKAYAMGLREMNKGRDAEAFPLFRRAIELDPNFAAAERTLAVRLHDTSWPKPNPEVQVLLQKAYDLRAGLTERERLMVTGSYQGSIVGDPAKFNETYELFTRLYPNDTHGYVSLCVGYKFTGQYEKALKACRDAFKIDSDNAFVYNNLVEALRDTNQFDEAQRLAEQALAKQFNPSWFLYSRFDLAFVKGDTAKVEQMANAARGTPAEGDALGFQARAAAISGTLRQAGDLFRQAIALGRRNGNLSVAMSCAYGWADAEAHFGQCQQARQHVVAALPLFRDVNSVNPGQLPAGSLRRDRSGRGAGGRIWSRERSACGGGQDRGRGGEGARCALQGPTRCHRRFCCPRPSGRSIGLALSTCRTGSCVARRTWRSDKGPRPPGSFRLCSITAGSIPSTSTGRSRTSAWHARWH